MEISTDPVTMTLEAFADTVLPGRKRGGHDPQIAGVSDTPGAVEAGALTLLFDEATGFAEGLPFLAPMLDGHAAKLAGEHDLVLDGGLPAFVALPHPHRETLLESLTRPDHPERDVWIGLFMFANMAFDSAAHLPTAQAVADGHPGLAAMGITTPDADGLWRFPAYSYRRELADRHPDTTPSGSPA